MTSPFYVYVLFRPWDGSPFYVGKGRGNRWMEHAAGRKNTRNRHLLSIFNKAQKLGLEVPRVKVRDDLTEQEAFAIESALIAAIGRRDRVGGPLANLTDGGEGASGNILSAESRAKISLSAIGNKRSLGKKISTETREKMRAIALNRSDEYKTRIRDSLSSLFRGKALSPEHRAKLAAAKRGKKQSAEHIAKRALSNTGKKRTAERRARMRTAQQAIGDKMGELVKVRWKNDEYRKRTTASMRRVKALQSNQLELNLQIVEELK